MWLTPDELTGPHTERPAGPELLAEEGDPSAWRGYRGDQQHVWLVPRDDPNAGPAPSDGLLRGAAALTIPRRAVVVTGER